MTHGERDCEVWLNGKGILRKEDQQFGEWLWVDSVRLAKKSVTVISGTSRSQALWWRKPGSKVHSSTGQSEEAPDRSFGYENIVEVGSPVTMAREIEGMKFNNKEGPKVSKKNKASCANSFPCRENVGSHANNSPPMPLGDCTNVTSPQIPAQRTRKWTKLLHDCNKANEAGPVLMDFDCRPGLEPGDEQGVKDNVWTFVILRIRKTFRWWLVSSTTTSNKLLKLELSGAWELPDRR